MENRAKITLPSVAEIPEILQALQAPVYKQKFPVATDYLKAHGILDRHRSKHDKYCPVGKIWTRNLSNADPRKVQTHDFYFDNNDYDRGSLYPTLNDICVMPRIQNPEVSGYDLALWQGKSVLTINDKIPVFPRWNLPQRDSKVLWEDVIETKKASVGYYQSFYNGNIAQNSAVYSHGNGNFILMKGESKKCAARFSTGIWCDGSISQYWFNTHPILAMRCKDGSIQILDMLTPCRFDSKNISGCQPGQELDTDSFEIGKSLKTIFNDLERSTEFTQFVSKEKLTQATQFDPGVLRDQNQNMIQGNTPKREF